MGQSKLKPIIPITKAAVHIELAPHQLSDWMADVNGLQLFYAEGDIVYFLDAKEKFSWPAKLPRNHRKMRSQSLKRLLLDQGYAYRRMQAFERDWWKCKQCDAFTQLECDHIIPRSRGRNDHLDNLQTLCHTCHRKKHGDIIGIGRPARSQETPSSEDVLWEDG